MRVLYLIPSLEFGGAARQLTLLAARLPRDRFAPYVCVLGTAGPWADELRAAGVEVQVIRARHPLDPRIYRGLLRTRHRSRPDVIHAWQVCPLWWAIPLGTGARRRFIASWPSGIRDRGGLGWLDRRLMPLCGGVTVAGAAAAERCRRLGLTGDRVAVIPPGVALAGAEPGVARRGLGLPPGARLIVGIGPLSVRKGFHDAIWAFNILQGLYDELHLVLVGGGPDVDRLRQFAHDVLAARRVHFAGPQPDVAGWLADAEVVWVPDRVGAGVNAALEALAAGRPVVASRLPQLAEVVRDGEEGLLVPPADPAALARQTRRLLDDAGLRGRLGEAGRRRAEEDYGAPAMVRRFAELYGSVGGG
jgi:glycosyltransferase involved in cell wall biosynthesis